jgi:hypothetical protein
MERKSSEMQEIGPATSAIQVGTLSDLKPEQGSKDIGSALFYEIEHFSESELELKRAAVRRKIDLCLMPVVGALRLNKTSIDTNVISKICLTYLVQFLDRSSLNYASAYTFIADLDLIG